MRIAVVLFFGLSLATPVLAKAPVAVHANLVQAQCEGPPAGPCSTLRFAKAVADLTTAKQPSPTCPKTGQNTENVGGSLKLTGVTSGGAPFTGTLFAEVSYKTTFGTDPNGTCSLAGVQIVVPSLQADVTCTNGKCKGTLYAIACLEKGCADTSITSELSSFIVYDGANAATDRKPLAVPGTFIAPGAGDAS